jgi:hypothetical protein
MAAGGEPEPALRTCHVHHGQILRKLNRKWIFHKINHQIKSWNDIWGRLLFSQKKKPMTQRQADIQYFLQLAPPAQHRLGVPVTQAASERLLSSAGNAVSAGWGHQIAEHVEQLVLLHGGVSD